MSLSIRVPVLAVSLLAALSFLPPSLFSQVNVVTQHNDNARTGQNLNETILTPALVSSGKFGKLFSQPVDGDVLAQPLYLSNLTLAAGKHNVVFVVTAHDSVYAFDADTTGPALWQATLLDAAHGAAAGATTDPETSTQCNAGVEVGITGTPAIDPVAGIIYLIGRTFENGYPVVRLHALDVTTGAEKPNSPVTLSASVKGSGVGSSNGTIVFDPKWEHQRPGLLLQNGIVYIAFGSFCDLGPYHGWIFAYNATSLAQTSVLITTPNGTGSGIWMSGAGLAADAPAGSPFGRMFVPLANGTYDATTPYGTNTADYGDDVIRLDLTNGVMTVTDAFTPYNQATLQQTDNDLGSGGVMLLPDQPLAGHTHQLLAAGKTGTIYVLDRDNLGGYNSGGTSDNDIESVINQIAGVYSSPAYWNQNVYYWAQEDWMTHFQFTNGLLNRYFLDYTKYAQTYPGSTPSISANGSNNAIVWTIDVSDPQNTGDAILEARDATSIGSSVLYSSANNASDNPGPGVKFTVPTIANGKVYLPMSGLLSVYGLVSSDFTLTPTPVINSLTQGGTATATITIGALDGFTGNVTLSASGLPTTVTASFAPSSIANTIIMTLTNSGTAPVGTSTISITGTSGSISHSVAVTLIVSAPSNASFSLTATPASVSQGGSTTSSIAVVPVNGFTGSVALTTTGTLPSGVIATFGTASGNTTSLTIAASSTATVGAFTLVVTGNSSGGLTSSVSVPVTINAQTFSSSVPYINAQTPGALRNNYTGFVGFGFTVGSAPVTLTSLGRYVAPGNSGTHTLKLVDGTSGNDVAGGSVSITMTGQAGTYQYATLASPIALNANSPYFLVSQETAGADQWYDIGMVTSTNVATITGPTYSDSANVQNLVAGLAGQSYVPVNFQYGVPSVPLTVSITSPVAGAVLSGNNAVVSTATTGLVANLQLQIDGVNAGTPNILTFDTTQLTNGTHILTVVASDAQSNSVTSTGVSVTISNLAGGTPFVIGQTPGPLRNNFSGFVGFSLTTGTSPLTITSLGRFVATGNSGVHLLELVNPDGSNVPGASVSVSLAGATPGQFFYGSLAGPVVLQPNTTYYLVSQEVSGGDQWYDYGFLSDTAVVTVNAPVYSTSPTSFTAVPGLPGESYVPLSFLYQAGAQSFTLTATPTVVASQQGQTGTTSIAIVPANGFSSIVNLSVTGVPTGVTASFSPITGGASTLSLTSSSTAAMGSYPLTVTGTAGSLTANVAVTLNLTNTLQSQTIIFPAISAQAVGAPLTLSATASSGLPVTYTSSTPTVCTVSGSSATLLTTGLCTITAAQAGNSAYSAANSVSQTFTIGLATQTITFGTIATQVVGTPLTLTATASSSLPVTYTSSTPAVCTVSGSVATFLTNGTCTLVASQSGNSTYTAATSVTQSFGVGLASQTITFATIPAQTVNTNLNVTASASSGLSVTYATSTPTVCTLSANTVSFLTSGTCTITVSQPGNSAFAAATPVSQNVSVNLASQTIAFGTISAQVVGTPLTLNATATSSLPVTYTSSTPTVCTVSGSTATFLANGTCTLVASQAGNGTYAAATSVSQSFGVGLASQTISFATVPAQVVGKPLTLSATASSALPVSYTSSTPAVCTVSGSTATFLTGGTCTLVAAQSGNSTYAAATSVTQSFSVGLASQTISFATVSPQVVGKPLTLTATATSGLAVTYSSSTSAVCTVSGTTASFLTNGTCTIVAAQSGNATYSAAPSVTQSFAVGLASQTISFPTIPAQVAGTTLGLTASATSNLTVTFTSGTTNVCTVTGTTASFLTIGTCTLTAAQTGNATYAAATPVTQSFSVTLQPQTITFPTIAAQKVGTPLTLTATSTSGLAVTYTSNSTTICTVSGSVATFLTPGSCSLTAAQSGNTKYAPATNVTQSFTVTGVSVTVNLASFFNVTDAIVTDGTTFSSSKGFDFSGYAYSSNLLGTTVTSGTNVFTLGAANGINAVANTTVTLPAGQYKTLVMLGASTFGNRTAQTFVINYTDGSKDTLTQSLSDWGSPQNYAGETVAAAMAYRDVSNGTKQAQAFDVYRYALAVNSAKTVKSLTLPATANVVFLAMDLNNY